MISVSGVDPTSVSQKILRNTVFNAVGRIWRMLTAIVLTPYIISVLGTERYGVWALTLTVTSYVGLLDLGVGMSFVKYVSEYDSKEDYQALNAIISSGVMYYVILGILLTSLVAVVSGAVLRVFKVPPALLAEARFVLIGAVVIYAVSSAFNVFRAVTVGLQRMDVTNAVNVVMSLPYILGTVLVLRRGLGLRGLIVNEFAVLVLTSLAFAGAAFRLLPSLRIGPTHISRWGYQKLFNYGVRVQISRMAELASSQLDKGLIGYFLGLNPVTYYELGFKVVNTSKLLSRVLVSAVMPAASELEARQELEMLRQLYERGSKYVIMVAAPLMLFAAASAPLIMRTWMGPGYALSVWAIEVLAIGHFTHLLTGVGTAIVKGIGKPGLETRYTLLLLVLNIILGITLVRWLGFPGALSATALSLVISSVYFLTIAHKELVIGLGDFIRRIYLIPLMSCLCVGLPIYVFNHALWPALLSAGRLPGLALLVVEGGLFVAGYAIFLRWTHYLDAYDRDILARIGQALLTAS
ncbi:MAG: hypothetical protein D6791_16600 [Chloroflexi bacterium]|nr:MAG: hypothetical protein D6791_16600 [Chloroflexota bacterium]